MLNKVANKDKRNKLFLTKRENIITIDNNKISDNFLILLK